ncbi:MAG: hypothetical protein HOM24_01850, partial [Flavobacteriales bacterium]|nr:hypothetical protein [Flavobacteriales bacterium]
MNILIKLTCLIGLVIAPILGEGNDASNIHAEEVLEAIDMTIDATEVEKISDTVNLDATTK